MDTYKGIKYRVMRSSFGTVNVVIVLFAGKQWEFPSIKRAKAFISDIA